MDDFVAKNNYYGEPREDKPNEERSKTWDFTKITCEQLGKELEKTMNSRTPFFIWSRVRRNEKIRLDNENLAFIFQKIQYLRATVAEFSQLQADAIFSSEFVNNLVEGKRAEAERNYQKAVADHQLYLTETKSKIDIANSLINHDQVELDRKIAENERIRIENKKTKEETKSIKTQNKLKKLVMSKINFDNFPPAYISELLVALSDINIKSFSEFERNEKLNDITVNMEQTKVRKAQAEVEDFMNSAEYRKWKNRKAQEDAGL
jgi:hypothetical protein